MIGDFAAQELKTVPHSNNTICKRIEKIADDTNDIIRTSNKDANLICYVRFIDKNGDIIEDLLFCKPILLSCKAHDLFAILNNFFEDNNVDWKYCVGLCTDGARAISGCFSGSRVLVQGVGPRAKWTHCLIQREALASQ